VGLAGREDDSISALSFGARRLVELARVIASRPRLVLLDEPSSGLSDPEVDEFAEMIRRLNQSECTVLLVEHNLSLVQALAQRVIAMDRGRKLGEGTATEVFGLPAFQEAYIGESTKVAA
jgi:branched-chain amino acid transport system ATP-binding protein